MVVRRSRGDFKYETVDLWSILPNGAGLIETAIVRVGSHGDIYVGGVSCTIGGSRMEAAKQLRSLTKLRQSQLAVIWLSHVMLGA